VSIEETLRQVVREEVEAAICKLRDELRAAPSTIAVEYLSTEQAAKLLAVHPDTVRRMVEAGKLPRREVAGKLRFARADLDRLLGAGDVTETAEDIAERMVRSA
jgi:excisionase family DNA binding protein